MGNKNFPNRPMLFNSVLNKDWGLYLDGSTQVLFCKKHGLHIPEVATVKYTDTEPGKYKTQLISLKQYPVAEGYPLEYGLTFKRKVRYPGVLNDEPKSYASYYGDRIITRAMVSDLIADADLFDMENEIIAQAAIDTKRFVKLRRAYKVTDTGNGDESTLTVTLQDGTAVTFATATTFAAGQLGLQFNANTDLNVNLKAYRIGADKYLITSREEGYLFKVEAGTDTTVDGRYILAENKEKDVQFVTEYDPDFATSEGMHLIDVDGTTNTTTGIDIYVNGVLHEPTHNNTLATLVANINTSVATHGVYALLDGSTHYNIYAPDTLDSFDFSLSDAATNVIDYESSPAGAFPYMTSNDLDRKFQNIPSDGALATQRRREVPEDGAIYRHYHIEWTITKDAVGGAANAVETVKNMADFYIKKSEAIANYFKATDSKYMDETLPSAADTSLHTLINALTS
mgnify:CR=1 FL=1